MALSWNEIKERAIAFSKEWEDYVNEKSDANAFLIAFFKVFGVSHKRVATFEHKVKKLDGRDGFIDMLWKGTLLVEMKSRGKDLNKAFGQAKDYFPGLKEHELPKYILVCDLHTFRLYDLETDRTYEFTIKELYKKVSLFGFISGHGNTVVYKEQDPVNIKAAESMGKLHDQLKAIGYEGHSLELYLVRLLFCMFADDTTIFNKNTFYDYILTRTTEDGSDLSPTISQIFDILNTPPEKRLKNLSEELSAFPYVNGRLFEERLPREGTVCGRLKSDYGYSASIVYNNFPWPENPTDKQIVSIEDKAQKVLDARAVFVGSSLADLYDPLLMPPALVKAHNELDRAVDAAYRSSPFASDTARMEYLFELYDKYNATIFTKQPKRKA